MAAEVTEHTPINPRSRRNRLLLSQRNHTQLSLPSPSRLPSTNPRCQMLALRLLTR